MVWCERKFLLDWGETQFLLLHWSVPIPILLWIIFHFTFLLVSSHLNFFLCHSKNMSTQPSSSSPVNLVSEQKQDEPNQHLHFCIRCPVLPGVFTFSAKNCRDGVCKTLAHLLNTGVLSFEAYTQSFKRCIPALLEFKQEWASEGCTQTLWSRLLKKHDLDNDYHNRIMYPVLVNQDQKILSTEMCNESEFVSRLLGNVDSISKLQLLLKNVDEGSSVQFLWMECVWLPRKKSFLIEEIFGLFVFHFSFVLDVFSRFIDFWVIHWFRGLGTFFDLLSLHFFCIFFSFSLFFSRERLTKDKEITLPELTFHGLLIRRASACYHFVLFFVFMLGCSNLYLIVLIALLMLFVFVKNT